MAQQALPDRVPYREARLGRPIGDTRAVHGVVLLLPGGRPASSRRPSTLATAATRRMARRMAQVGRQDALVAHVLHYRYRGWNGTAAHTAQDAEWAVRELVQRYGDIPVCLVGTDVGARAALRAAGHPAVEAVLAIAPWLPKAGEETGEYGEPLHEPVGQLAERQVLMVHGTDDEHCDPDLSYRLAVRAKEITPDVSRFEVHTDGHGLRHHRSEVTALAEDFVLGTLCGRDYARPLTDAMAAPPPLGLRMPLASGFGRSLRH